MSVYSAIIATRIKIPAEKSLLSHLQYVRELLDRGAIAGLCWVDTRDMIADALTKGMPDRSVIEAAIQGTIRFNHEQERWTPRLHFQ